MRGGERSRSVLIVEDDPAFARLVGDVLASDLGADVHVAGSAADGIARLTARRFGAAVVDRRLPDGDGFDLVRRLRAGGSALPVVVLTADVAPASVVAALRAGACDYVAKSATAPVEVARCLEALRFAAAAAAADETRGAGTLVGRSAAMERVRVAVRRCARSSASVLVSGETGVGKELVARALHHEGARREGPFVAVNCGALPEHLIESELFGHVRGAFTGAHRDHPGLVAAAARGTLFLDEVEDLPLVLQGKLLRLLQEGEYRPVGGLKTCAADVRVVAAANVDLGALVEKRALRSDLYYRLNVLSIAVPPLRAHAGDIPELVERFATAIAERAARDPDRRQAAAGREFAGHALPARVLAALESYAWPGNVRELGNLVERVFVTAAVAGWERGWDAVLEAGAIGAAWDAALVAAPPAVPAPWALAAPPSLPPWRPAAAMADRERPPAATGVPARADAPADSATAGGLRRVLDRHRWRRAAAARELGISRVTLWRRMRRLGLCGDEPAEGATAGAAFHSR